MFNFLFSYLLLSQFVLATEITETSKGVQVVSKAHGIKVELYETTYSHSLLRVYHTSSQNLFQMVFKEESLENISLQADHYFLSDLNSGKIRAPSAQELALLNRFYKHLDTVRNFQRKSILLKALEALTTSNKNLSICNQMGTWKIGSFSWKNRINHVLSPVGEEATQCYGLCGGKCSKWINRWSESCLSHDLCHRITGEQLGDCKDEFLEAAVSVPSSPTCE